MKNKYMYENFAELQNNEDCVQNTVNAYYYHPVYRHKDRDEIDDHKDDEFSMEFLFGLVLILF